MTRADPIALVMIGCGSFARRYHVPTLEADPAVSFTGIFDPSPSDATRDLAQRTAAPLTSTLDALADPAAATMAVVTTPHALHAGHVAFALRRNWHVLCDKPFVLAAEEARALAAEASGRGRINAVAFNRRFIRGGGIGAVRYVQTVQLGYERHGWFLLPGLGGGGPYTGRATHMADIVPWLLDQGAYGGAQPHPWRQRGAGRSRRVHRADVRRS